MEEEARKCQWLDCDREGENIAFEVLEVCTQANRHLDVWRARFSALIAVRFSLTPIFFLSSDFLMGDVGSFREIHESVQNLVRPNQLFADAVDARQVSTFSHSNTTS